MGKKRREGDLRIGPATCADPRLRPEDGLASVGGGGELCRDAMPIDDRGVDGIRPELDFADHSLVKNEVFGRRGDVRKAFDQDIVLDIFAEGGKADLARREGHRGYRKPRPRGIDHRNPRQRRGLAAKTQPYAKRFIKAQRGLEKRNGSPVGAAIDMANADYGKSRLRESDRGGETGGAGAGHQNAGFRFGGFERHSAAFVWRFRPAGRIWRVFRAKSNRERHHKPDIAEIGAKCKSPAP